MADDCVQRHDERDEDYSDAYLANVNEEIAAQKRREWLQIAWVIGPMVILNAVLYLIGVMA